MLTLTFGTPSPTSASRSSDDAVVVPVRVAAEGVSGARVTTAMGYVYRFRDGKVIAATGFTNLAEAFKAVGFEK
jgi:ketosteroid isomerase-like protein